VRLCFSFNLTDSTGLFCGSAGRSTGVQKEVHDLLVQLEASVEALGEENRAKNETFNELVKLLQSFISSPCTPNFAPCDSTPVKQNSTCSTNSEYSLLLGSDIYGNFNEIL